MKLLNKILNKKYTDKNYSSNKYKNFIVNIFFAFSGIILLVIFWTIISHFIITRPGFEQYRGFMPGPAVKALIEMTMSKYFWQSVASSFIRILIGLTLASLIGIPAGILIGFYKYLHGITNIPIHFIRMISPIAWTPIALIIFPGFNGAILFLIFISTVWPILINTSLGVFNIKPEWIKMTENQGANDYQMLFRVIVPGSLPYILSGLRMAVGIAWIVLIPAEMLGVTNGLGYLINNARDTISYDKLIAVVIAIGILGFIIDSLFQLLQSKLDWRDK